MYEQQKCEINTMPLNAHWTFGKRIQHTFEFSLRTCENYGLLEDTIHGLYFACITRACGLGMINFIVPHLKMKEDMVAIVVENARKMFVIQEELMASNAKMDAILVMMSKMHSFVAAPQPSYPFSPNTPCGPYP